MNCVGGQTIDPSGSRAFIPSGSTYAWFNQQDDLISSASTFFTDTSGVFGLRMSAPNGCQSDFDIPVFVAENLDLGSDQINCGNVTLRDNTVPPTGTTVSYAWFRDGISLSQANSSIQATESASYRLERTVSVGSVSCTTSSTVEIQIDDQAVIDLGEDVSICQGETHSFDAGQEFDTFNWLRLSDNSSVGNSRFLEAAVTSDYRLVASSGTCVAVDTVRLTVNQSPVSVITADQVQACDGESIVFRSSSSMPPSGFTIENVLWDFGDGTSSDQNTFTKTYSGPGDYTVTLATSSNGCSHSTTALITNQPTTLFQISHLTRCVWVNRLHFQIAVPLQGPGHCPTVGILVI